jgi:hypothetical protein
MLLAKGAMRRICCLRWGYATRWPLSPRGCRLQEPPPSYGARRGLPYLAARLPVVIEPVEVRLNRVGLQAGLVILAQLVSAPLRTRT